MVLRDYLADFGGRDWQEIEEGTVRIAAIGLGWWTRDEAIPAIQNGDLCETTVVVSGSIEKADRVAAEVETVEAAITYEDFHDGAAVDAYDAVYICTPNATHLEYVETAAELGKAILCEKPMEATVEAAEKIVEAADAANVPLMIAYRMQTEPAIRRAKELVQDGFIGEPLQVHGHMADDILTLAGGPDQWRLDPELSGGTTVNDIGIYPINTTRFVLEEDPVAVYGRTRWEHEAFEGLDEHAAFQLEFESGLEAACTVSHNAHQTSHLRFIGTEGELTVEPIFFPWDDRELVLRHGDSRGEIRFEQVDQMEEEFDYFGQCVLTGADPYPDGRHGLIDMQVIAAIYESAESGERIELEYG